MQKRSVLTFVNKGYSTKNAHLPRKVCYNLGCFLKTLAYFFVSSFSQFSWGYKYRFWQIFVEVIEEFPILIIQPKTSASAASTNEYFESNWAGTALKIQHLALATSGTKTAGSVPSRRRDSPSTGTLFPRLHIVLDHHLCLSKIYNDEPQQHRERFGHYSINNNITIIKVYL